jgi:hypothetical protein
MFDISTKYCSNSNCDQLNPQKITQFYKDKRTKDGLYAHCKKCHAIFTHSWSKSDNGKTSLPIRYEKWLKSPKGKITRSKVDKKWRESPHGRAKRASLNAKREATKLHATPKWLTGEQCREIEAIYILAREKSIEIGIEHHVDHIVPLQGKNVRGLHVPWNLQILTESENCAKKNKYDI